MRGRIIFAVGMLCACLAVGETVVVTAPQYLPSSTHAHIAVTQYGKAVKGVGVDVFSNHDQGGISQFWRGSTDAEGAVSSPMLPAGKYHIAAKFGKRQADLFIEVKADQHQPSIFEMKLLRLDGLDAAEQNPVNVWLRDFRGLVQDPTGAVISGAKIEVLHKDSIDAGEVLQIQSDQKGQFAEQLGNAGEYVAVFQYPGFKNVVIAFAMEGKGWKALKVTMQVGGTTTPPTGIAELEGK